jgi:adenylate cyclase class 2
VARPEGLEPPAYWFEASRSIRLSYGRVDPIVSLATGMATGTRYVETEIKLRCPAGAGEARRIIEQHGYALREPRTLESDQLFDRPEGELKRADAILRLRRSGDRAMVTYKGPATRERYKSREEIEFDVSDPENFVVMLARLGYAGVFRYEKYRTKFGLPGEPGTITLDETPIGVFLELEGTTEWIDRTAACLGFSPAEYLTASYAALYWEYRQTNKSAPSDMTFDGI